MRGIVSFVTAIVFVLGFGCAVQAADLATGSVWINENNSTLIINSVDSNTGLMTGTFTTGVGCGVGVQRPMTGFYNQGAMTFTVNFQNCNSGTSWAGQLSATGNQIMTLWYLALSGMPQWNSIIAGTDTFTLQ
jgi:hypothetical protein